LILIRREQAFLHWKREVGYLSRSILMKILIYCSLGKREQSYENAGFVLSFALLNAVMYVESERQIQICFNMVISY
jgi:hypothetical protein